MSGEVQTLVSCSLQALLCCCLIVVLDAALFLLFLLSLSALKRLLRSVLEYAVLISLDLSQRLLPSRRNACIPDLLLRVEASGIMFVHRGSLRQSYSIHAACRLNFERKSRFLFRTYVWRIVSCDKRRFSQPDDRPVSLLGIRSKGLLDVDKHQHCHRATC